jgi:hypothetical protein
MDRNTSMYVSSGYFAQIRSVCAHYVRNISSLIRSSCYGENNGNNNIDANRSVNPYIRSIFMRSKYSRVDRPISDISVPIEVFHEESVDSNTNDTKKHVITFDESVLSCQRVIRGYLGRCKVRRKRYEAILEVEAYWTGVMAAIEEESQRAIETEINNQKDLVKEVYS